MTSVVSSGDKSLSQSETFRCRNCGGLVQYDIASRKFLCVSCKSEHQIEALKDSVDEYRFDDYRIREQSTAQISGVTTVRCDSCGGEIYFDASDTATRCPMCGSSKVRTDVATSGIAPEGIVPFRVDAYDAQQRFRSWIKKRWFAPDLLKKAYAEGALEGLYVPFWTYDADARGEYFGQGGRTRVVRDREGNTKTVTDWFPVSGVVFDTFDDILVCASQKQSGSAVRGVLPYNTVTDIVPFSPQYLAGYKAERYSIDGVTCFGEARSIMESQLESNAHTDIMMKGFDCANVTSLNVGYRNVTYKSVLLPMYTAQYGYKGALYGYAINGQSGRVTGSYPKSAVKIALFVLAIILIVLAIVYFSGGFEEDGYSAGYSYYTVPVGAVSQIACGAVPSEQAFLNGTTNFGSMTGEG